MARTTSDKVVRILGGQYDSKGKPTLDVFIDTASAMVDDCVANDTYSVLTAAKCEIIERWLAAHCYAAMDQLYASQGLGKVNATYQGTTEMNLSGTKYGQMAMMADTSGYLRALSKGGVIPGMAWLGETPDDQIDAANDLNNENN